MWSSANINWGKKHYQSIIKSDGRGYYAHLPALFIYNDLNFQFFDSLDGRKYYDENLYYEYRSIIDGDTVNKYYAGTAIPMMPFFLMAHGLSRMSETQPSDGYSKYYQISINIAAIVFLALTLWVMIMILRMHSVRESIIALSIPLIVFGTNWFYYVVAEPAMSHPYSVFFISLLALMSMKWNREVEEKKRTGYLLLFALTLGLITVIRPLNGISGLFLLVFSKDPEDFWTKLRSMLMKPRVILTAVVLFVLPLTFQFSIYKVQTGNWWVYSYGEEGFDFLHPQIINILFSYKKGLFLYTPLLLIALFGMRQLWLRNKWESALIAGYLILITYLFASWWNWQYGGSFSSRVYLDYFVLFIIPLGLFLNELKRRLFKWVTIAVVVLLALFCQFQTYQYRYGVIHWEDMNKETYWDAFLNIDFITEKKAFP